MIIQILLRRDCLLLEKFDVKDRHKLTVGKEYIGINATGGLQKLVNIDGVSDISHRPLIHNGSEVELQFWWLVDL